MLKVTNILWAYDGCERSGASGSGPDGVKGFA